ncbi:MAG: hypothetical protein M1120_03025 [Patescibacteria group bacterium]|nr:hypothetical protein [Patescibacteria group bacterium]
MPEQENLLPPRDSLYFYNLRTRILEQFKQENISSKTASQLFSSAQKCHELRKKGKDKDADKIVQDLYKKNGQQATLVATMTQYLNEASQEATGHKEKETNWHDGLKFAVKDYRLQ